MPTYSKQLLSGSIDGKGILVVATSTPGTAIHTAVSGSSALDEIYLYAYNGHNSSVELTIEWGGTTVPNDNIKVTIPNKAGRFPIVDGRLLRNNNVIRAFANIANVIVIDGFVNNIS